MMTSKEMTIQNYMNKLHISREEAEQLYNDEMEDNLPELTAEQKAVEKEMMRSDRKVETTPRKRERKADDEKRYLIAFLAVALSESRVSDLVVTNEEREIKFTLNGNSYQLTLVKNRKPKEEK